ncbi:pyramus [Haematobia irritans]|uniref:pyramus n=1 Tax=Haematobia irritans TaxID=7368 RepID=UPI003F4F841D
MLPQFTLNARIIFAIMVMFAFATTACSKKTNDYVIMLKNHERALHVNAAGKVSAKDISLAQFFTMESVGDILSDTFKIALYVKEVGRYLCFRKGKLVGMKHLNPDCHFIESLDHGYFLYANAYNPTWRVGFTRSFKPVGPRHLKRAQSMRRACFLFVKIAAEHFDRDMFTTSTTSSTSTTTTTTTTEAPSLPPSPKTLMESQIFPTRSHRIGNKNDGHDEDDDDLKSIRRDALENEREEKLGMGDLPNYLGEPLAKKPKLFRHLGDLDIWPEEEEGNSNHGGARKRKHHYHHNHHHQHHPHHSHNNNNKLAGPLGNLEAAAGGSSLPQPKNLIRPQPTRKAGEERRRRKFQREEHVRKRRLHNQRKRKQIESHHHHHQQPHHLPPNSSESNTTPPPSSQPPLASAGSSSSSASSLVSATSLAATVSLAPSALNIVAMLAAGRRKKGRRKNQGSGEGDESEEVVNTGSSRSEKNQKSMDMQLVAQKSLEKNQGLLYDDVSQLETRKYHHHHRHHEHSYYQQKSNSPWGVVIPTIDHHHNATAIPAIPATPEHIVQPQNLQYSNSSPKESNLNSNSRSHSRSRSRSRSSSSSHSLSNRQRKHSHSPSPSNIHSHSYSHSHSHSHNLEDIEEDSKENFQTNINVNATIPALPKNYNLSSLDNSYNQQKQQQQQQQQQHYLNIMTDFQKPATTITPLFASHKEFRQHSQASNTRGGRLKRDLSLIINHVNTSQQSQSLHFHPNDGVSKKSLTAFHNGKVADQPSDEESKQESRKYDISHYEKNSRDDDDDDDNDDYDDNDGHEDYVNNKDKNESNTKGPLKPWVMVIANNNNNNNSNRLLDNSSKPRREDNNFHNQQQQRQQQHRQHLLVNRLKLIYRNRISNDSRCNCKKTNLNEIHILKTKNNDNNLQIFKATEKSKNNYNKSLSLGNSHPIKQKHITINDKKSPSPSSSFFSHWPLSSLDIKATNRNINIISHDDDDKNLKQFNNILNTNNIEDIDVMNPIKTFSKKNKIDIITASSYANANANKFFASIASASILPTTTTATPTRFSIGQKQLSRQLLLMLLQPQQQQHRTVIDNKFYRNINKNNIDDDNNNNNNINLINVHYIYNQGKNVNQDDAIDINHVNMKQKKNTAYYDDYHDVIDNVLHKKYEKFIRNENKYEKIIVQYRSVVQFIALTIVDLLLKFPLPHQKFYDFFHFFNPIPFFFLSLYTGSYSNELPFDFNNGGLFCFEEEDEINCENTTNEGLLSMNVSRNLMPKLPQILDGNKQEVADEDEYVGNRINSKREIFEIQDTVEREHHLSSRISREHLWITAAADSSPPSDILDDVTWFSFPNIPLKGDERNQERDRHSDLSSRELTAICTKE